jgi:hypothetical protein
MDRIIQRYIIDVIAMHRLVNESCTRIGIIITSKYYELIIHQIYDILFEDQVMMHFLSWRLIIFVLTLISVTRFRVRQVLAGPVSAQSLISVHSPEGPRKGHRGEVMH